MDAGTQEEIEKDNLIDYIIWKIWADKLDFYDPSKDLIIDTPVEEEKVEA
jgi:hypothetical protein